MNGSTVVVAMSGGVDSSIAAAMLHEQGYRVVGVTMKLWDYASVGGNENLDRACCTIESMNDARSVCQKLGVPHYTVDLRQAFEQSVIRDFVREYEAGRTPNPCVRCNSHIKWKVLLTKARALGADMIATGHYARIIRRDDGVAELRTGLDPKKDQSYALWGVPQETLRVTLLPLGSITKDETRARAAALGLKTADKPESQDICFIPDNDYGRFLTEWNERTGDASGSLEPGDVRDGGGNVVGTHRGVAHYTIGQRKGLGIAVGRPQFVTRIDASSKTIWVGEPEQLMQRRLTAHDANWSLGVPPESGQRVQARIRYAARPAAAMVESHEDGTFAVVFDDAQRAITPGQSVVIYDGDLVLGGGVIQHAE